MPNPCSLLLSCCQLNAHRILARDLLLYLLPAHWHDELARQRSECGKCMFMSVQVCGHLP